MSFGRKSFLISCVCVLVASCFLAYRGTLKGLVSVWYTDEDYSYGFLIPLIAGYLVWDRRAAFKSALISSNWVGGALFFLFLLVSTYGILGSSPSAVRPAFPFVLLAIVLFCFGLSIFKVLFLPIFFLIFMVPLPTTVQTNIGVPLKLLSTKLGSGLLGVFGVSAFVQGNVIDLGNIQLQVVDACSGLRYIFPLLALGVLAACFSEKTQWKRAVIILLTIPVAVITNGVRIGATGILAQKYGSSVAEGFFHGFSGWLIFMFAFVLIILSVVLLKMIRGGDPKPGILSRLIERILNKGESGRSVIPSIICICALLLVSGISQATGALPRLTLKEGFSGFPMTIGQWSGEPDRMDSNMVALSGAEEALSAKYMGPDGKAVFLYIGYRGSPFMENENFFHSPNVCLPSQGWNTLQLNKRIIQKVSRLGLIQATEMVIENMNARQLVDYWFQTKNNTSDNVNINRFQLTLHALKHDNTYDLFIRPITPIYPNESVKDAEVRMDRFCREMTGNVLQYLESRLGK